MTAEFLESELLRRAGFRHAFFTRQGGVSSGPYRSLNFSSAVGDDPTNVAKNLVLAAEALGTAPERIYFLSQVHGVEAMTVDGSENRDEMLHRRGDAVLARAKGVTVGVRSADCVPVLVADPATGAVAAIHAGWRGTAAGVVAHAIEGLRELIGARGELLAAIGPHISADAFEVSDEVAAELAACCPDAGVVIRDRGPRPHVDLRRIVRSQLAELGLPDAAIDDVFGCTVGDPDRFFSYRRDGKVGGRHLSAIVAR